MVALCSFVVVCGLIKCMIIGTSLDKHFSLVSGLIILVMVISGVRTYDFNDLQVDADHHVSEGAYDELVEQKAEDILEKNISGTLLGRYGLECDVDVELTFENEIYTVSHVVLSGTDDVGYIKLYLADYLSVEEDVISFA